MITIESRGGGGPGGLLVPVPNTGPWPGGLDVITVDSRFGGGPGTGGFGVITKEGSLSVSRSGAWVMMMDTRSGGVTGPGGPDVTGWVMGPGKVSSTGAGVAVGIETPDPPEPPAPESPCFTLTQRTWPILQAVWYPYTWKCSCFVPNISRQRGARMHWRPFSCLSLGTTHLILKGSGHPLCGEMWIK